MSPGDCDAGQCPMMADFVEKLFGTPLSRNIDSAERFNAHG